MTTTITMHLANLPRALPAPRRAAKKKKPAPKKKRSKKGSTSSGENGPLFAKIGGGLITTLFVVGMIIKLLNVAGVDVGVSWQSYTTPDTNVTVQMPGKAKRLVNGKALVPGGQSFGVERRNFGCAIVIESLPAEAKAVSEEELMKIMEGGLRELGATNITRSTQNGKPCVKFNSQNQKAGYTTNCLAFIHKRKVYTLNYVYKGMSGSNQAKFFDSVQFN